MAKFAYVNQALILHVLKLYKSARFNERQADASLHIYVAGAFKSSEIFCNYNKTFTIFFVFLLQKKKKSTSKDLMMR